MHDALRATENPHIAPLLGHVEVDDVDGSTSTVAFLQSFVPNASDGWRLATSSVRDLYAEADLHADEVGGDFAGEAERLGEATASVHRDLAAVLPTSTVAPTGTPSWPISSQPASTRPRASSPSWPSTPTGCACSTPRSAS